jgi:hypothetical protein
MQAHQLRRCHAPGGGLTPPARAPPRRTSLHFVRCIKPNGRQAADCFDSPLALHQLRCCGILEVARIARAGYPTRYAHADFAERYRLLLPGLGAAGPLPAGTTALNVCARLLAHFGVDSGLYQVGRTKVFFRAGVLGQLEDRAARAQRSALTLQSAWRMVRCRRDFLAERAAAITVQAHWRGDAARREAAELRRRHAAATVLQAAVRAAAARAAFLRTRAAATCVQAGWRRLQLDRRVASRTHVRLAAEAEARAEEEREAAAAEALATARRTEQESYDAVKLEFGMDGGEVREVLAMWRDHGSKFQGYLAWEAAGGAATVAAATAAAAAAVAAADAREAEAARLAEEAEEDAAAHAARVDAVAADVWRENAAFADAKAAAAEGKRPHVIQVMAIAGGASPPLSARLSDAGSDDTVSIMSYDAAGATPTSRTAAAAAAAGRAGGGGPAFGRAGGAGAVAALAAELDKKSGLFDDDAAFIREVHDGVSSAPAMDPDHEIARLLTRYKAWHHDFRGRLKETQRSLRRAAQYSPSGGVLTPRGGGDGSLTARLISFARGPRPTAAR